jgi:hypothetical protein
LFQKPVAVGAFAWTSPASTKLAPRIWLPRIDQIVYSTAGCDLLCFLDAFSGYHQIKMAMEDDEKTAFITPCGVYYYTCMPFILRNAGATF